MMPGFIVSCREGQAAVSLLPTQTQPTQPLLTIARDSTSRTVATLLGRLDYSDELDVPRSDRQAGSEPCDAAVALAVYLQSGTRGLEPLEGEFALVVWDGRARRLIGMRDPLGSWPLYWAVCGNNVAMSTDLRALSDKGDSLPLDLDYVAEYFATPFLDAEVPSTRTALAGIQRVLPGTIVELAADGQSRRHTYWDWPSRIEAIRANRLSDVAGRFRELLDRAVRQRLRLGRTVTHLSGGMDSSAVTVLAQRALAETSARSSLVTISLTHQAAELAPERGHMDLILQQGGRFEPHFLPGDKAVGFDWFGPALPQHEEPYAGLWSLAANRQLADAAERCRAACVLTGVGGDEILCYRPLHIADLLRRGRLLRGYREARAWAEGQGQGVWSVLHKCGLEPLWPALSRALCWPLRVCGCAARLRSGRWSIPAWIRPEFARQHHLEDQCSQHLLRLFASHAESAETLMRLAMSSGDWARWHLYAPRGINISHPFLDPRVACFTLGIPRTVRAIPGDPKPLLRAATEGILPDAIRNRREKTGFDGPRARGMAMNLGHLEELVCSSPLRDLRLFDSGKLLRAMHQVAVGIGSRHNQWIDRCLALLAWFQQRSTRADSTHVCTQEDQVLPETPVCGGSGAGWALPERKQFFWQGLAVSARQY
jgi:asparagine synthase (glutamine-hydrolysing)